MGRTARCGPLTTLDGIGDPVTQTRTAELVGFDALTRTADGGVLSVNQAGRVWPSTTPAPPFGHGAWRSAARL